MKVLWKRPKRFVGAIGTNIIANLLTFVVTTATGNFLGEQHSFVLMQRIAFWVLLWPAGLFTFMRVLIYVVLPFLVLWPLFRRPLDKRTACWVRAGHLLAIVFLSGFLGYFALWPTTEPKVGFLITGPPAPVDDPTLRWTSRIQTLADLILDAEGADDLQSEMHIEIKAYALPDKAAIPFGAEFPPTGGRSDWLADYAHNRSEGMVVWLDIGARSGESQVYIQTFFDPKPRQQSIENLIYPKGCDAGEERQLPFPRLDEDYRNIDALNSGLIPLTRYLLAVHLIQQQMDTGAVDSQAARRKFKSILALLRWEMGENTYADRIMDTAPYWFYRILAEYAAGEGDPLMNEATLQFIRTMLDRLDAKADLAAPSCSFIKTVLRQIITADSATYKDLEEDLEATYRKLQEKLQLDPYNYDTAETLNPLNVFPKFQVLRLAFEANWFIWCALAQEEPKKCSIPAPDMPSENDLAQSIPSPDTLLERAFLNYADIYNIYRYRIDQKDDVAAVPLQIYSRLVWLCHNVASPISPEAQELREHYCPKRFYPEMRRRLRQNNNEDMDAFLIPAPPPLFQDATNIVTTFAEHIPYIALAIPDEGPSYPEKLPEELTVHVEVGDNTTEPYRFQRIKSFRELYVLRDPSGQIPDKLPFCDLLTREEYASRLRLRLIPLSSTLLPAPEKQKHQEELVIIEARPEVRIRVEYGGNSRDFPSLQKISVGLQLTPYGSLIARGEGSSRSGSISGCAEDFCMLLVLTCRAQDTAGSDRPLQLRIPIDQIDFEDIKDRRLVLDEEGIELNIYPRISGSRQFSKKGHLDRENLIFMFEFSEQEVEKWFASGDRIYKMGLTLTFVDGLTKTVKIEIPEIPEIPAETP